MTFPHLAQLNLTYFNCGNTPVRLVTTPETRTNVFTCVRLGMPVNISYDAVKSQYNILKDIPEISQSVERG